MSTNNKVTIINNKKTGNIVGLKLLSKLNVAKAQLPAMAKIKPVTLAIAPKNKYSIALMVKICFLPQLNQGDGIHPSKEGHRILAENVW